MTGGSEVQVTAKLTSPAVRWKAYNYNAMQLNLHKHRAHISTCCHPQSLRQWLNFAMLIVSSLSHLSLVCEQFLSSPNFSKKIELQIAWVWKRARKRLLSNLWSPSFLPLTPIWWLWLIDLPRLKFPSYFLLPNPSSFLLLFCIIYSFPLTCRIWGK